MSHAMNEVLDEWLYTDPLKAPKVMLFKSNTVDSKVPAFCSGGDVKTCIVEAFEDLREGKLDHLGTGKLGVNSADFMRYEYYVNHKLAALSTSCLTTGVKEKSRQNDPIQVSFWDGITMGGGVGVSMYAKYRVATERTIWAMPETAIGLFPDVGAMYWMPRLLSMDMAAYLCLTGRRLNASELMYTGIATHYVPSESLNSLEADIENAVWEGSSIEEVLNESSVDLPAMEPKLARDREAIRATFGVALEKQSSSPLLDILDALQENVENPEHSEFAQLTLDTLAKVSPTSCAVSLEALRRGAAMSSFADDLAMEYRLCQWFCRPRPDGSTPDFYEGIRAVLIDKDHKPVWGKTAAELTPEYVATYFAPIPHEWDLADKQRQREAELNWIPPPRPSSKM